MENIQSNFSRVKTNHCNLSVLVIAVLSHLFQVVDCMLRKKPGVSARQYQNQLKLYTSSGLLPTMAIYNSTNSATFPFKLILVRWAKIKMNKINGLSNYLNSMTFYFYLFLLCVLCAFPLLVRMHPPGEWTSPDTTLLSTQVSLFLINEPIY